MSSRICQSTLPLKPWCVPQMARLPGTGPIEADAWVVRDEVFGDQMALVDDLLQTERAQVLQTDPRAEAASVELLAALTQVLATADGYTCTPDTVVRPDGVAVSLAGDAPLATARRLVQEDLLVHLPVDGAYRLLAGALAFPASWTLAEKFGHDLARIHAPVDSYDANIATRVARLFDGLRPGRPLMRANWHGYEHPDLFQPRTEAGRRDKTVVNFIRIERQCLLRLPVSLAVVFTIHTYVVPLSVLSAQDRDMVSGRT